MCVVGTMAEPKTVHYDKIVEVLDMSTTVKRYNWVGGELVVEFSEGGYANDLLDDLYQWGVDVDQVVFHDNAIRFSRR